MKESQIPSEGDCRPHWNRSKRSEIMESLIAEGAPIQPLQNETKPRLLIVLNGGCVVSVYAGQKQEVKIIDIDDLEEGYPTDPHVINEIIKESTTGLKEIY